MSSSKKHKLKEHAPSAVRNLKTAALQDAALPPIADFDATKLFGFAESLLPTLKSVSQQITALRSAIENVNRVGRLEALGRSMIPETIERASAELGGGLTHCLRDLDGIRKELSEWHVAERQSRRPRFVKAAELLNWKITGNWPELVVQEIVFLVIDEAKDRATVNGRSIQGAPTVEKLIDGVEVELTTLLKNRPDPKDFIVDLWKAFRACGGEPGKGVEVFQLMREVTWLRQTKAFQRDARSDLFRSYPMAQFRADLTHYLGSGAPPMRDGKTTYNLEIVGGSFAQDALFMYFPQTERLASCGRLTFQLSKDDPQ